jgi:hypothetical protein
MVEDLNYIVIVCCLLSLHVTLGGQKAGEETAVAVYQKVPAEQRKSLAEAVEKLVAAEKKGDWKTVYELSDKRSEETWSKFFKKMSHKRLLREFSPSKVTFMPPDGSWNIQGCASFEGDPDRHGHVADITALWSGSRWYLSAVAFVPFGDEKKATLQDCFIPEF